MTQSLSAAPFYWYCKIIVARNLQIWYNNRSEKSEHQGILSCTIYGIRGTAASKRARVATTAICTFSTRCGIWTGRRYTVRRRVSTILYQHTPTFRSFADCDLICKGRLFYVLCCSDLKLLSPRLNKSPFFKFKYDFLLYLLYIITSMGYILCTVDENRNRIFISY